MKNLRWITGIMAVMMAGQLVMAEGAPSSRGRGGFAAALEHEVGLTPEQRDAVRGLLAKQRQETQALRDETDQKIRGMLNAEQQKKFDGFLADQKAQRQSRRNRRPAGN